MQPNLGLPEGSNLTHKAIFPKQHPPLSQLTLLMTSADGQEGGVQFCIACVN